MASLAEISEAVDTARNNGCSELVLLHCISGYPTPIDEANLRTISDLAKRFEAVIGLSDHTVGRTAAVAAVVLGAGLIEKHYTLIGLTAVPMPPFPFSQMSCSASAPSERLAVARHRGLCIKPSEQANLKFRRSLYVVQDVAAGERFTAENVRTFGRAQAFRRRRSGQCWGVRRRDRSSAARRSIGA